VSRTFVVCSCERIVLLKSRFVSGDGMLDNMRTVRKKLSQSSYHAVKKSPAELERDIAEALAHARAKDYRVSVRVEGASKPVYVSPWMTHAQAEQAAKNHKAMIRDRGWTQVVEIEDKNGLVTRLPR
jgi:hypothetical protein